LHCAKSSGQGLGEKVREEEWIQVCGFDCKHFSYSTSKSLGGVEELHTSCDDPVHHHEIHCFHDNLSTYYFTSCSVMEIGGAVTAVTVSRGGQILACSGANGIIKSQKIHSSSPRKN